MQKAHDATYNTYWENLPSMATPIVAGQLNRNEQTVDTLDDRIISLDVLKGDKSMLLKSVGSTEVDVDPITFDEETGVFTIRLNNGTSYEIDTNLEKLAVNFYYDSDPASQHYQQLVITLEDGTLQYVDLSALVNQYDFANSPTIGFTNIQGIISADIINGSVTDQKMQPNYLADITAQAQSGAQSAINASGFKLDSEAWAIGTRNGQAVPQSDPAYHNNSKYWAAQANVTSLEALTDVYIDQPRDLQYLGYDATEEYFTLMDIPQADSTPVRLIVISEEGSEVVITKPDGDTVTPTHIQSGQWQADFFGASAYGTYQIDAVLGGDDAQVSVNVDDCKVYVIDDSHFHASIIVTYPAGATVSCVKTGEPTQYATSSPYTFVVHSLGEYTITGTRNGITEVQTVTITASEQVVNVTLTILPDGETITPTDDVQILLNCAAIWDKSYTNISQLIADDTSLLKVLTSDNAIDYLVRSTTFASAITADSDAMAMIGSYDYCADTLIDNATWKTAIDGSAYKSSVYNAPNDTRVAGGVQTWLRSGGITDKTYTTLAEVLADTTTLSALIANHDAVDYLVTAKGLIDGIVADATAMSYIGLNNYCANTLLADAEWRKGICNSTYFESVLNVKVPAMTSDTTPSGECWQENPSTNPTYYAFDGNVSTSTNDNAFTIPVRIGYSFPNAKKIFKTVANIARILTGKIQGSNDKTTWYDIADYTGTSSQTEQSIVSSSNIEEYKHYAIQCLTSSATGQYAKMIVTELQFYGREDV